MKKYWGLGVENERDDSKPPADDASKLDLAMDEAPTLYRVQRNAL